MNKFPKWASNGFRASNGQRFPCPALPLFLNEVFLVFLVFLGVSKAASLIGDKVLYNGEIFYWVPKKLVFFHKEVDFFGHPLYGAILTLLQQIC